MEIQLLEILKWVGVVFVAGFIGYFGRYLSMLIIERVRKRKADSPIPNEVVKEVPPNQDDQSDTKRLKLEKKRLKLEKKKAKKAGE